MTTIASLERSPKTSKRKSAVGPIVVSCILFFFLVESCLFQLNDSPEDFDSQRMLTSLDLDLQFSSRQQNGQPITLNSLVQSLPVNQPIVNCTHETLHAPKHLVLSYLAVSSKLMYPNSFENGRSISGKARERIKMWNDKETPYAWTTILYVLKQLRGEPILVDLDSEPTYRAFYALLAASEGYMSIAYTSAPGLVCPSLFINPGFHQRVLVVNATKPITTTPALPSSSQPLVLHMRDCQDISTMLTPESLPTVSAIYCVWFLAESDSLPSLQGSLLQPWTYNKTLAIWQRAVLSPHLLPKSRGVLRVLYTDLKEMGELHERVNRTLPKHKWFWESKDSVDDVDTK